MKKLSALAFSILLPSSGIFADKAYEEAKAYVPQELLDHVKAVNDGVLPEVYYTNRNSNEKFNPKYKTNKQLDSLFEDMEKEALGIQSPQKTTTQSKKAK